MKFNKWTLGLTLVASLVIESASASILSTNTVTRTNQTGGIDTIITVTEVAPTNSSSTNSSSGVINDLKLAGLDLWGDFLLAKPFTTNGNATVRLGAGANTSSHKLVAAAMVTVPTSTHTAIGGVIAYRNGQLYEGGANLTLGVTNNWGFIGEVDEFAGDGIIYNFNTREPANYSFTGIDKPLIRSSRVDFGIGGVLCNTSDESGVDIIAGIHFTYFWSARKTIDGPTP